MTLRYWLDGRSALSHDDKTYRRREKLDQQSETFSNFARGLAARLHVGKCSQKKCTRYNSTTLGIRKSITYHFPCKTDDHASCTLDVSDEMRCFLLGAAKPFFQVRFDIALSDTGA